MPALNIRKWTGSLVTTLDQADLVPGDFSILRNFIYDDAGNPAVRGGRRKWITTQLTESGAVTLNGLYYFKQGWTNIRPRDYVVTYAGSKILKSEMDGAWDEIQDDLETDLSPSFCTLRGWFIFASDSESHLRPKFWNGAMSEMQELRDAPEGRIVASHAGRLWVVDKDDGSKIWYSVPFEPANWRLDLGAGFLSVNPGDGNVISALIPGFAGEMVIFKDGPDGGSTYRLQGLSQDTFEIVPLSSTLGAISHQVAHLIADRDIFFASRRGIHSLRRVQEFGDLESTFLDAEVSNIWRNLPERQKLRAAAVDDFTHDTWWLSYDRNADGANDKCLLFNYRHQNARSNPKISEMDYGWNSACVFRDSEPGKSYLLTGGSDGYARREHNPEANDDGTDYSWKAVLAPIDAGDEFKMKSWKQAWIGMETWGKATVDAEWYGDNRRPSSGSLSMNPNSVPIPFNDGTILNTTRSIPHGLRDVQVLSLMEGGIALTLSFTGTRGRSALTGLRLMYEMGEENAAAGKMLTYVSAEE